MGQGRHELGSVLVKHRRGGGSLPQPFSNSVPNYFFNILMIIENSNYQTCISYQETSMVLIKRHTCYY